MASPKKSQIELGFNHNVKYKGKIFHVQTEDSGVSNPHIITHLFEGGNILATKKTSYSDIIQAENLPDIVRELMQEQHKAMLRNLINGVYDGLGVPHGLPLGARLEAPESGAASAEFLPIAPRSPGTATPKPAAVPIMPSTPPPPASQPPTPRGPVPIPSVPGPLPALHPSNIPQPVFASAIPNQARSSTYSLVAGESSTLKETVHLAPVSVSQSSLSGAQKISTSASAGQPAPATGKFPLPSKPPASTFPPIVGTPVPKAEAKRAQPPPLPRNISPPPLPETLNDAPNQESERQRISATANSDESMPPEVLAARRMVDKPVLKETSGPTIFGEDLITEKSLDDVILSYLSGEGDKPK